MAMPTTEQTGNELVINKRHVPPKRAILRQKLNRKAQQENL